VDGDKVICSPGGCKGTLAALDKTNGKVLWRSEGLTDAATYSSAIVAEVGGIRQYIQVARNGVVGVAAKDGKKLWKVHLEFGGAATIPTTIFHDGYVFAISGYGKGCGLIKLTPDGSGGITAEKVYRNARASNRHGGAVLYEGHIYFSPEGRNWACLDLM